MDYLDYVSTCGPDSHPITTASVIKAESSFNPLVVRNNTLKQTYYPKTLEDAIHLVNKFTEKNHKVAIGLMQITNEWFHKLNIKPTDLLNGCHNIKYGSKILSLNYKSCSYLKSTQKEALECALSMYWTGKPDTGGVYINNIYAKGGSHNRVKETPGVTDGVLYSKKRYSYKIRSNKNGYNLVATNINFTPAKHIQNSFDVTLGGFDFPQNQ